MKRKKQQQDKPKKRPVGRPVERQMPDPYRVFGQRTMRGCSAQRFVGDMAPSLRSAHLQEIWGVGPWTCDMVAIFFYGDPDVWPAGDVSVQKTLQKFVGDKTLGIADRCSPYRSTLALYLWRILDGERKPNVNERNPW